MIEQAMEHLQAGNYPAAEVLYRKMLEDEPDNPEVLFMLSIVRQSQNDLDEPLQLLQKAVHVQPGNPTLHNAMGLLRLRRREMNEAERSFHQAVEIDPNFADAQNGIAAVELARGRFAAAEHALRKALKAEPENTRALLSMGVAMLEQGRGADATGYLQQVVSAEPENFAAQIQLGRAFNVAGNPGFAIGCFENALKLNPDSLEAVRLLADAEYESGQYAPAAAHFNRVVESGGENGEVMSRLARALAKTGRLREAEGAFLRALKLSDGEEKVLLDFARLLLERSRPGEVIARLGSRLESATDQPRMARLMAEAELQNGQPGKSIELLRPLVSEGAGDNRLRLLLARALDASGEKDAALGQVERLLQQEPPVVEAVLFAANHEASQGNFDSAIERLRTMQRRHDLRHDDRQQAVSSLAGALHDTGQYQAAWEQYLALDPRTAEVIAIQAELPLQLEKNEPAESAMSREVAWSWPPQPLDDGRPEPIFVFGWPGSGRMDLLRALAAHSGIRVIQGKTEAERDRRIGISHPQGAGPLGTLSQARLQLARRKYWRALQRIDPGAGQVATVDAMWLTAEAIPTLYRLFPQAHMLVLQHDPNDLAVSWLRNGYGDLEGMSKAYGKQMELLKRCRAGVPLNWVDLDANRLAAEPGAVLRETIGALSLAWDGAVETAFNARPTTDLSKPGIAANYRPWMKSVFDAFA